jgi:RNA polymerase sigma factor (sigma-70 family)
MCGHMGEVEMLAGNESGGDGVLHHTTHERRQPIVTTSVTSSQLPAAGEPDVAWSPPTWEEIVEQHSARVYRLAYRLTGNPHDAEDLTHDVFVRVFRSLHSYQPGTFEGWLHRITTNVFLDKMRRKQRIRFDSLPEDAAGRLASLEKGPEQTYHDSRFDDDVQRALDALAPEFRAAVVLCDIEGLSYEEISATLGVKLGTVRSRIHRGRAQLREALAHRAPEVVSATGSQTAKPESRTARAALRLPGRRVAAGTR